MRRGEEDHGWRVATRILGLILSRSWVREESNELGGNLVDNGEVGRSGPMGGMAHEVIISRLNLILEATRGCLEARIDEDRGEIGEGVQEKVLGLISITMKIML